MLMNKIFQTVDETIAQENFQKKRNLNLNRCWISILSFILIFGTSVLAQVTTGNVRGTVKDETGAVIAGARVTLISKSTSNSLTTQSSSNGDYQFNNLLVGEYKITVEATNFKTLTLNDVLVQLNKTTDIPTICQAGAKDEIVEVSAGGSELVETTTTTLSKGFSSKQAVDLAQAAAPGVGGVGNTGGGIYNLALIAPNVSSSGGVGLGSGGSVGGQRPRNNNFTLDGIDNNALDVTGPSIYVSPETISEFSLLSNQFSAEFGHSSGGQFNVTTKSGTNEFHGTGYAFLQNRNLNALDTLQKLAGTIRERIPGKPYLPRYDYNRDGFNAGGPIIKNKLFFFASYEGQQYGNASSPGNITAPTAAGFAKLNGIAGLSATNLAVFKQFMPVAPINDAKFITVAGTEIPIGNVTFDAPNFQNQRNFTFNVDYTQSETTQHRFRFLFDRQRSINTAANLPAFYTLIPQDGRLFSYTFLHSFTPTLTNEFRFSYRRSVKRFGVPSIEYPGLDQFPNIGLNDLSINIGPDPNAPQSGIENSYQFVDNISYTLGNHLLKFGVDARKIISPQRFVQRERGDYGYNSTDSFLRDLSPDSIGERNVGGNTYYGDKKIFFGFAQDDWRLRSNLTLNLGVRYEYTGIPIGAKAQSLNAISSVPGIIDFRAPKEQKTNFAPKIGLAYAPNFQDGLMHKLFGSSGESSIRAGFSMAYDVIPDNLYILSSPPQFQQTIDVDLTTQTPNFLANGGIRNIATGSSGTPAEIRAATTGFIPDQKLPYSISYSLSFQRQFLKDWALELRYVGTRGIHLATQNRINRVNKVTDTEFLPTFFQKPSQKELDASPLTLTTLKNKSEFDGVFGGAGFNQNNLVTFLSNGNSTYNAFSAQITRRLSNGFQVNTAYTWSHLIDDSTADVFSTVLNPRRQQDFQNFRPDRADSALDRRHRLVLSSIYELPFFNKSSNGLVRALLGGVQFAGTLTFESGQKATVLSGIDSNLNGDSAGDRTIRNPNGAKNTASKVTPLKNTNGDIVGYLADNPNAEYIQTGAGARATSGRNTLQLPGIKNLDFSVFKDFRFKETMKVQFRADFFNAFNTAQYTPGAVNGSQPISTTGAGDVNTLERENLDNFNNAARVFSSHPRSVQLALRFNF